MRLAACTLALLLAPVGLTGPALAGGAPLPAPEAAGQAPQVPVVKKKPKAVTTPGLVEPHLHLAAGDAGAVRVALTFDACSGKTDGRILSTLIDNRIPATIFATARWLKRNPQSVALLKANPDLFEVENHGKAHVPAVDRPATVYGIVAAGSPAAVAEEVKGGADALVASGFAAPHWFRGATARYDTPAMEEIGTMGYRVAGYSLNGDDGALATAATAEKRLATARDGAVIIAHINQPDRPAGTGIAAGILKLKARGVTFVRLMDAAEQTGDKATH
nr:polysaccharide deacetylase family protein [uncultured Gellertiella sp.]